MEIDFVIVSKVRFVHLLIFYFKLFNIAMRLISGSVGIGHCLIWVKNEIKKCIFPLELGLELDIGYQTKGTISVSAAVFLLSSSKPIGNL